MGSSFLFSFYGFNYFIRLGITGLIGGLFTSFSIKIRLKDLNFKDVKSKQIWITTIGWTFAFIFGGLWGYGLISMFTFGLIGGVSTAFGIKSVCSQFKVKHIIIVSTGWILASSAQILLFLIDLYIIAFLFGILFGFIGMVATLWLISKESSESMKEGNQNE